MIDGLRQAMQQIYAVIPMEILEAAFQPYQTQTTLDECIKNKVLLARVRDDISVRGGKVLRIMLDPKWSHYTRSPSTYSLGISGSYSTFHVPPEAREGRDISTILAVRFPYTLNTHSVNGNFNNCSLKGNTVSGLACAALQAQTGSQLVSSPTGVVRPGNVIQLDPPQYTWIPWEVIVRLRYDDNFSGMDVSLIESFKRVCEYAVKSYIYTTLIFKIETNLVVRGMDIGIMKDIVSSYSDANEKYEEQLIQLGGAEIFDPDRLAGILRRMVPKR